MTVGELEDLRDEVERLRAENGALREAAADVAKVDEWIVRAEAAEARLRAVEALADEWESISLPNSGDVDYTRRASRIFALRDAAHRLRAALASVPSGGVAPTERERDEALARLRAVEALADDWEGLAGEESEAWRVFGPQMISVPFAVAALRAALASVPSGGVAPTEQAGEATEPCPLDAGQRPYWMGVDQYDPCQCLLTKGHEPPCVCSHTAEKDPRTSAATPTAEAGKQ